MRLSEFTLALDKSVNRIKWLKRRHPKAAKKRRIMKKWRNRFGADYDETVTKLMQDQLINGNAFFRMIPKEVGFEGSYIPVPVRVPIQDVINDNSSQ